MKTLLHAARRLLGCIALIGAVAALSPAVGAADPNNIVSAEYFIDTDPGEGLATPLPPRDGAFDSEDESIELNITIPANLPIGPHYVYVRMKSALGIWSSPRKHVFNVDGPRSITAAEFFFDNPDVAPGSGTPLAMRNGPGTSKNLEGLNIPLTGLAPGLHTVYVRAKDQDNQWGPARAYTFQVLPEPTVGAAEFLVGRTPDPEGIWQPMSPQSGFEFLFPTVLVEAQINSRLLPRGHHEVWVRARDNDGRVSLAPVSAEFDVLKEFPQFDVIGDQLVRAGGTISIRPNFISAIPGAFALAAGAPAGMTIDPATGIVYWTPAANETPGERTITILFDDGSVPPLQLAQTFTIVVEDAAGGGRPALVSARAFRGSGYADLVFSRPLNAASANNPENYRVNGARPHSATLRLDGRTVTLASASISEGDFQIEVLALEDTLGNALAEPIAGTGTIVPMLARDLGGANPAPGAVFARGETAADISAAGVGFTTSTDAARFAYEEVFGDFDVRVQVKAFAISDYFSTAGLVARESISPNARSVAALARPASLDAPPSGVDLGYRVVALARSGASAAVSIGDSTCSAPPATWLRMRRVGDLFETFYSQDGVSYLPLGNVTIALPERLLLGLAAASGLEAGLPAHAKFDNYAFLKPAIVSQPVSQRVPQGSQAIFGATFRGEAPMTFQWFRNNEPLPGMTSPTLQIASVGVANLGSYFVEAHNAHGTTRTASATLDLGGVIGGLKGDVAPRASGDGQIGVGDWVQTARFAVGLDTPSSAELYRADSAPRATSGDGVLTVMDMVQTARYVVGLDAPPAAAAKVLARDTAEPTIRILKLASSTIGQAGDVEIPVTLTGGGGENALGFSIAFDPAKIRLGSARLAEAVSGGSIYLNNQTALGKAGLAVALPATSGLPPGESRVCWLAFQVLATAGNIDIALSEEPVRAEVVDVNANALPVISQGGVIAVGAEGILPVIVRSGANLFELTFPAQSGRSYRIDVSSDFADWTTWRNLQAAGPLQRVELPAIDGPGHRFYRVTAE